MKKIISMAMAFMMIVMLWGCAPKETTEVAPPPETDTTAVMVQKCDELLEETAFLEDIESDVAAEWNRMLKIEGKVPCIEFNITRTPEETVSMVEEWSIAHPRKTRQSAFLEQYPNAKCVDGNIYLCPKMIDTCFSCPIDCNDEFDCFVCKREFWSQEVE